MSLIGKKYYPCDNSYCVNLTSSAVYPYKNNTKARLAGTQTGEKVKECIIVSEPFKCIISNLKTEKYTMILVEYNNETYSVLYDPRCVK